MSTPIENEEAEIMKRNWTVLAVAIVVGLVLAPAQTVLAAGEEPPRVPWQSWIVRGEVVAVTERILVLDTARGELPVLTGAETTFRVPGTASPSLADVAVGDDAVVLGRRIGLAVFARLIAVVEPGAELARVGGQVNAVQGHTITLNTASGSTVFLDTDEDTLFYVPGIEDPTLDDVVPGAVVVASGIWQDDGVLHTYVVGVPRETRRTSRITGEVTAVEGETLTVRTRGARTVTLTTDEATSFHILDVEAAGLGDIPAGSTVTVQARISAGIPYASAIILWPEDPARLHGEVVTVGENSLTLETEDGTVEVLTSVNTIISVPGVADATLEDIQVGDAATCAGAWSGDSAFQALVVVVRPQAASSEPGAFYRQTTTSPKGDSGLVGSGRW